MRPIQKLIFATFLLTTFTVLAKEPDSSYKVSILTPQNEQTFQHADTVTVVVNIEPPLFENDLVSVLVDGQEAFTPEGTTSFTLPTLSRGVHTVQAKVIKASGEEVLSDIVTFYQQRARKKS